MIPKIVEQATIQALVDDTESLFGFKAYKLHGSRTVKVEGLMPMEAWVFRAWFWDRVLELRPKWDQ